LIVATDCMNSASNDLKLHLGELRARLLHETGYERAFHYFLEEFGGDAAFVAMGDVDKAAHLEAVITHIASKALGKPAPLVEARISRLLGHGFKHGCAAVDGRAAIFFYFEADNTGLLAIIPGARGEAEIARFRLPPELAARPEDN
jgi:hypothetical protein